jgi:hypothetical protein
VLEESGLFVAQFRLLVPCRALYERDRLGVDRIANVKQLSIEKDCMRHVTPGGQERAIAADHVGSITSCFAFRAARSRSSRSTRIPNS